MNPRVATNVRAATIAPPGRCGGRPAWAVPQFRRSVRPRRPVRRSPGSQALGAGAAAAARGARPSSACGASPAQARGTGPGRGRCGSRRRGCRGGSRRSPWPRRGARAAERDGRRGRCPWFARRPWPPRSALRSASVGRGGFVLSVGGRLTRGGGADPAHEARCPTVGKRVMSRPHSAIRTWAVRTATPGIVHSSSTTRACGARASSTRSSSVWIATSSASMWPSSWAAMIPWWATSKRLASASRSCGIFDRMRAFASSASCSGSVTPASSASSIARADFEYVCEATLVSLMPASCNTFSRRWIARMRSLICALRSRVRSRSRRISGGGTKLGRTRPCSTSWQIHSESFTSVLRPGTLRRCCALSSQHSKRSSSAWKTVFQYTPVASIPTSVTPSPASHSRRSASPASVARNVRVCC